MIFTLKPAQSLPMIDATLKRNRTHHMKTLQALCGRYQGIFLQARSFFIIFICDFVNGDIPIPTTSIGAFCSETFEFINDRNRFCFHTTIIANFLKKGRKKASPKTGLKKKKDYSTFDCLNILYYHIPMR